MGYTTECTIDAYHMKTECCGGYAMIFAKSVKQFLRTPVTAALFVILFAAAAFFISSGTVIWARNQATIKAYESVFLTIGTVRQPPASFEIILEWDILTKTYAYDTENTWSSTIQPSVLDFDGAGYVIGPERRPFYGAFRPDLTLEPANVKRSITTHAVMEVTPLEDCIPDGQVEVCVLRVLNEYMQEMHDTPPEIGEIIRLCDHYNDDPQPLYAGKTYIMYAEKQEHDIRNMNYYSTEWVPHPVDFSTQNRKDGTLVDGDVTHPSISEVTDGFYETEEGRRWLEFAYALPRFHMFLPVLPTNGTNLLLPFYDSMAYIVDGEDIAAEEYSNGDRVCLVSESFAKMNSLSVGDMLQLPLSYADYSRAPVVRYYENDPSVVGTTAEFNYWWRIRSPLNAAGEIYPVFSDHEYTIKGIYRNNMYDGNAEHDMGANTVVIPMASVRESDENNILDYGPMEDATTSFQIPNGTIEAYTEKWLAQGIDGLEITFHDRGYTQLHRGLEDMKRVAMLFIAIGVAMSITLVFFFCNVFITKNRTRTAIERMLGFTKMQCAASLLAAFLLAAVLAVAAGSVTGAYAEKRISDSVATKDYYDTTCTIGPLGEKGKGLEVVEVSPLYAPAAGAALLALTVIVSAFFMRGNVKGEPLKLLSGKEA